MEDCLNSLEQQKESFSDAMKFWEWVKYNIRKESIAYSKINASRLRNEGRLLQEHVDKANLENDPSSINKAILDAAKEKIEKHYEYQIKRDLDKS